MENTELIIFCIIVFLQVCNTRYTMLEMNQDGGEVQLVPNIPAVLDDFMIMGDGLVDKINVKDKKATVAV